MDFSQEMLDYVGSVCNSGQLVTILNESPKELLLSCSDSKPAGVMFRKPWDGLVSEKGARSTLSPDALRSKLYQIYKMNDKSVKILSPGDGNKMRKIRVKPALDALNNDYDRLVQMQRRIVLNISNEQDEPEAPTASQQLDQYGHVQNLIRCLPDGSVSVRTPDGKVSNSKMHLDITRMPPVELARVYEPLQAPTSSTPYYQNYVKLLTAPSPSPSPPPDSTVELPSTSTTAAEIPTETTDTDAHIKEISDELADIFGEEGEISLPSPPHALIGEVDLNFFNELLGMNQIEGELEQNHSPATFQEISLQINPLQNNLSNVLQGRSPSPNISQEEMAFLSNHSNEINLINIQQYLEDISGGVRNDDLEDGEIAPVSSGYSSLSAVEDDRDLSLQNGLDMPGLETIDSSEESEAEVDSVIEEDNGEEGRNSSLQNGLHMPGLETIDSSEESEAEVDSVIEEDNGEMGRNSSLQNGDRLPEPEPTDSSGESKGEGEIDSLVEEDNVEEAEGNDSSLQNGVRVPEPEPMDSSEESKGEVDLVIDEDNVEDGRDSTLQNGDRAPEPMDSSEESEGEVFSEEEEADDNDELVMDVPAPTQVHANYDEDDQDVLILHAEQDPNDFQ